MCVCSVCAGCVCRFGALCLIYVHGQVSGGKHVSNVKMNPEGVPSCGELSGGELS